MAKYASPKETDKTRFIAQWLETIEAARDAEKDWRKEADAAIKAYRAEGQDATPAHTFNIWHSNISLLVPSIYNSTPAPDVRRRFADSDPVGKTVADLIERSLSYFADACEFDDGQTAAVYDMAITGRGLTRVRLEVETPEPDDISGEDEEGGDEPTAEKPEPVTAATEYRLVNEYVPWTRFIRPPGVTWRNTPWIAFELFLSRDEVEEQLPEFKAAARYRYADTATPPGEDGQKEQSDETTTKRFKLAQFFEVWDRTKRQILFLSPDAKGVVVSRPDSMGLRDFFPIARPMHAIAMVGGQVPVSPRTIYAELLGELDDVTKRIKRLVKQLRPRGIYAGKADGIKRLAEAVDGELVAATDVSAELATTSPSLDKMISWFPMEPTALALRELLEQRREIKQQIYEVTGLSDIMRGATNAQETASAQKLKASFGSMRIKSMQGEVARHARDTFRLFVELIASKIPLRSLSEIASIPLLPKAQQELIKAQAQANPEQAAAIAAQNPAMKEAVTGPSVEDVMSVLTSPKLLSYRIDIETDSTIRADAMRLQEQMGLFLQGAAQYMQAIGPAVQQGAIPGKVAVELFAAYARQFNLGKSAEDALERLSDQIEQQPQGGAQNAQAQVADAASQRETAAKVQVEREKMQVNAQQKQQDVAARSAIDQQKIELEKAKLAAQAQQQEQDAALRQYEIELAHERDMEKARMDDAVKRTVAAQNADIAARKVQVQASAAKSNGAHR